MNIENCPCCSNHCSKDNLGCRRGIEHFNAQDNTSKPQSIKDQVINDLRRCGHMLHHNEVNTSEVLSNFTEEELNELHQLLTRIK